MIIDSPQSKPLLPFTSPSYPPAEPYSSLSSSSRSSRASSPPPFARQSSKQLAKAAFSGRRRLGFLLATVLWVYAGASWLTGRRPGMAAVASWVPAAPAGLSLNGVVHGSVFANDGRPEGVVDVESEVEAKGLTVLGPEADRVYELERPSLAEYQTTLEHFLVDHFPPEDSDLDDPDSLIHAMRRFFPTKNEPSRAPPIPTKLFQTAPSKEPYSRQNKVARDSWETLNPGYEYLIADDGDMHQWVQERFALSLSSTARKRQFRRQVGLQEEDDEEEVEVNEAPEEEEEEAAEEEAKAELDVVFVTDGEDDGFSLSDEPDLAEDEQDRVSEITFEDADEEAETEAELAQEVQAEAGVDDVAEETEDDLVDSPEMLEEDEYWADPPSQGRGIAAAWNAMGHPPVLRADFWRYLVLAVEGGYYADVDVTCLKPMAEWGLDPSMEGEAPEGFVFPSLIVGVEADVGDRHDWAKYYPRPLQLSQWTMASARGHPILLDVLRRIVETTFASYAEEVAYMATKAALLDAPSPAIQTDPAQVEHRQAALDAARPPFRSVMAWTGPGVWTDAVLEYVGAKWGAQWAEFRGLGEDGWRGGRGREGEVKVASITAFSPGVNHMGAREATDRAALAKHAFAGSWTSQEGATTPGYD